MLHDRFSRKFGAWLRNDISLNHLSQNPVRRSGRDNISNFGKLGNTFLDFRGRELSPRDANDFVAPPMQIIESLAVTMAEVARPQPSRKHGGRSLFRLTQIAGEDMLSANPNFTLHAWFEGISIFIGDAHLDAIDGDSH